MGCRRWIPSLLTAIVVVLSPQLIVESSAMSMPSACSACSKVFQPLHQRLKEEKIGEKNIDLRNRLNPRGQREGKQVEYKDSELRVVTLVEGICDEFSTISYVQSADPQNKTGETIKEWKEVSSKARKGKNAAYHTKMQQKFMSYCAFLLDEHEDEIARLIRSYDKASDTNVGSLFCGEYLKACPVVGDGGEGAGASTDSHGGDL